MKTANISVDEYLKICSYDTNCDYTLCNNYIILYIYIYKLIFN